MGLVLMAVQDTILIKQLSGLEWRQVQTVKLHLNFKFIHLMLPE
jgi:hypothetical protein